MNKVKSKTYHSYYSEQNITISRVDMSQLGDIEVVLTSSF
jgi:predicted DNA-binding ArsR family transcriptional regulator